MIQEFHSIWNELSIGDFKKKLEETRDLFTNSNLYVRHWFDEKYGVWLVDENYNLVMGKSFELRAP